MEIGFIGIGKLGVCLASLINTAGYNVYTYDKNSINSKNLSQKKIKSEEPDLESLVKQTNGITHCDTVKQLTAKSKIIFVCVNTPSLTNGEYDISAVEDVCQKIKTNQGVAESIVIVCTTNPGDCDRLELKYGIEILYSPEFIAQGSIVKDLKSPDLFLGTSGKINSHILLNIYKKIILKPELTKFFFLSNKSLEIIKIAINCFLTTKISFANMVGQVLHESDRGHEISEALAAIGSDHRINDKYLNFGYGFGGPCFPRDNRAFASFMKKAGVDCELGSVVDKFNVSHNLFLAQLLKKQNCQRLPFLFDSLSYKKGVKMFVESRPLDVAEILCKNGFKIYVKDHTEIPMLNFEVLPYTNEEVFYVNI